ncbi:hypothetical protein A1O7_08578 [Cladophialophora yegresii CBS 114405]|uniref:Transmembrane protein n=1 Tax=Cladophialophora yegresii CBS 114405 TaxID=1182544 RepID=W9WAR3_9EURO|nr:uncharacterized protein A1O7_08578 [Cladophialophora yegresii CBS 114405]EXJ55649.1 hypothetical protein A1O7_08578 [Cladophialophora yegresii CBS 114405]
MTERSERRQQLKTSYVTNADTRPKDRGEALPSRSDRQRRHVAVPDNSPHVSINASSSKSSTHTPMPSVSCDGDHASVPASRAPRKVLSKPEPDAGSGQAEENVRVRANFETTLATTGYIKKGLLAATDQLVTSHLFRSVLLFLILLGAVWLARRQVSNIDAAMIDVAVRSWSLLETTSLAAFDIAIRTAASVVQLSVLGGRWIDNQGGYRGLLRQATESILGVGTLCASTTTLWIATWLHIPCVPLDVQIVTGILNETVRELDGWVGISDTLPPYIDSFYWATTPLQSVQTRLQWSDVALPPKEALTKTLTRYMRELLISAQRMYSITLTTNRLLVMAVINLKEVQVMVDEVTTPSKRWTWTAQQHASAEEMLYRLIDGFDKLIANTAEATSSCLATLEKAHALGLECGGLAAQCREAIAAMPEAQYASPFGLFIRKTDDLLTALSRLVQDSTQPNTKSIIDKLAHGRRKLNNHRAKLAQTRTVISVSRAPTNATALQPLREAIHEVLGYLNTAKQRPRPNRNYGRPDEEGFFTMPPAFSAMPVVMPASIKAAPVVTITESFG